MTDGLATVSHLPEPADDAALEADELAELLEDVLSALEQLEARQGATEAAVTSLAVVVGQLGQVAGSILAELREARAAGLWRAVKGRRPR